MNAAADRARLDAIHAHECSDFEVRARTIRGGSIQHVRQCLECGEPIGGPLRQIGVVPKFDESILTAWANERRELSEQLQSSKQTDWWVQYKDYLESERWHAKRRLVLARDKHTCQGCLAAPATEVHHLTYDHATEEFAFELISLCEPCHELIHASKEK